MSGPNAPKTNWPLVISVASLLVALAGFALMILNPITLENRLTALETTVSIEVKNLKERIDRLDK